MTDTIPTTITPETLLELQAATPASARKTRQGPKQHSGDCQKVYGVCQQPHKDLTYVDARYVMAVLDSELGPANWQDQYQIGEGGKVGCRIGIYITFADGPQWVWKGDGAGETDIEGQKGSFSDAFKRAAVKWGIARDLYGEDTTQGQGVVTGSVSAQSPSGDGAYQPAPAAPAASPQPVAAIPAVRYQDQDKEELGECPVHHIPWTLQPAGTSKSTGKEYAAFWKCGAKDGSKFCSEKPSKAWQARREAA